MPREDVRLAGWDGITGRFVQLVIVIYAVAILFFIWMTKDMTVASLRSDPLFAAYTVSVLIYILSRFVVAMFYRSVRDIGHRPTVSIIVPAFNEEEGIGWTIASCLAVDYPKELV